MFSSLRSRLQLACTRTTLTRVHFYFVLVAFIHCVSLILLQSFSFAVNSEGRHLLIHIMQITGAPRDVLAVVATGPTALYSCQDVPSDGLTAGDFAAMRRMCTQLSPPPGTDEDAEPLNVERPPEPHELPQDPDLDDAEDDDDSDSDDGDDTDGDSDSDSDSDDEEDDEEEDDEAVKAPVPVARMGKRSLYRSSTQAAVVQRHVRRFLYPNNLVLHPDVRNSSLAGVTVVNFNTHGGIRDSNGDLFLSTSCTAALRYPEQMLQDMERENVSFLFFHVWLLIISVIAITQQSIPHIVSALAGQALATVFSIWDIFRTLKFHTRLDVLVNDALCGGADLLPNFWRLRNSFNISDASINVVALGIASWLSYKLIKMWLGANFRSVDAAPRIKKLYSMLMAFSALLRLYFFFVVLTAALWIDQIAGGLMHTFLRRAQYDGYLAMCNIALIFALPLVILGDLSMRREWRKPAAGFLVMQVFFLVFHAALLASSPIFRWTLIVWPFLALVVGAAFLLAAAVLAMGIVCRLNFGRGLEHYLHVTDILERDGFTPALIPASPFVLPVAERTASGRFEAMIERGDTLRIKAAQSMAPVPRESLLEQGPAFNGAAESMRPSLVAVPAPSLTLSVPAPPPVSRWSGTTVETKMLSVPAGQSPRGSWDSSLARADSGFYSESASSATVSQPYDIREATRVSDIMRK